MKEKTASITAEDMAGYRHLEMLRPKEERICEDPFASHFLNAQWIRAFKSPLLGLFYKTLGRIINPGAPEAVVARARFIDEFIKEMKDQGMTQLVILGSGYDCRAFRLPILQEGVEVFEVDHPATQEKKRQKLEAIFDRIPSHIKFVPCEFENRKFGEKLTRAGYDKTRISLFIMEGLIMYLSRQDIQSLFSYISQNSAPESAIVFDFLVPGIEDGTTRIRGGKSMYKWAIRKGEPFQFGIDIKALPGFLTDTGFNNVTAVPAEACREKYFKGKSRNRRISPLFSFAHARVASRE